MTFGRVISQVLHVVAIVAFIHVLREPGSTLLWLALGFFLLARLGASVGVTHSGSGLRTGSGAQMAAGFFLVFALGFAYMGRQAQQGQEVIARWIAPYPNISDIEVIPNIGDKDHRDVWGLIITSGDPPAKVRAFYRDKTHYAGWRRTGGGPLVVFQKPKYLLELWIGPKHGGTSMIYQLKRAGK